LTIYRKDASGKFVPFEETPFPDLERVLEEWIESNPYVLLDGEQIAIIGRQPRSEFGKYLDLLGIDASGACVVIELKRGETPRDIVAQTLEYAAWVDSLSLSDLDLIAREYAERRGIEAESVVESIEGCSAQRLRKGRTPKTKLSGSPSTPDSGWS
jgi:RecB family endonuclease NucS